MKIGIDISQSAHEGTGVARFTRGLIDSILLYDIDNTWVFFYSSLRKPLSPAIRHAIAISRHKLVELPFPPTFLSFLWNTIHIIPVEWFVGKVDWFISSDWTEPPSHCNKATVIHDLTVLKHPETVHQTILATQKARLTWIQKESKTIIVDSQATEHDVNSYCKDKIGVIKTIYPGVSIATPTEAQVAEVKRKYALDRPFILSVGKVEPRKNIPRLIKAFSQMNDCKIELIIVGPKGWSGDIQPAKNVRILGYVSDKELQVLYAQCLFFAYPSLWEGFGYPVAEAMLHKKAVLTSCVASLKEVGAKGSLFCDPLSVQDIQTKLEILAADSAMRTKLAQEGFEHAQQYTWKNYFSQLINVLTLQR